MKWLINEDFVYIFWYSAQRVFRCFESLFIDDWFIKLLTLLLLVMREFGILELIINVKGKSKPLTFIHNCLIRCANRSEKSSKQNFLYPIINPFQHNAPLEIAFDGRNSTNYTLKKNFLLAKESFVLENHLETSMRMKLNSSTLLRLSSSKSPSRRRRLWRNCSDIIPFFIFRLLVISPHKKYFSRENNFKRCFICVFSLEGILIKTSIFWDPAWTHSNELSHQPPAKWF